MRRIQRSQLLADKRNIEDIVLWHDIVSNSINIHKSNRNTPVTSTNWKQSWTDSVTEYLLWFTREDTVPRITSSSWRREVLGYWRENFSQTVSKSKQTLSELRRVHPCVKIENPFFDIFCRHRKKSHKNSYAKKRKQQTTPAVVKEKQRSSSKGRTSEKTSNQQSRQRRFINNYFR